MRFWLGGYGADMGGEAAGIGELRAGEVIDHLAGGPLAFAGTAAAASSPSWLSAHPRLDVVYAALEGQGAVQAFRRTSERGFARLGDPVPAGDLVCHVAVDPDGTRLVASCWGDGRVVAMGLDAAGRPHTPEIAASAGDPFSSGDPFAVAGESVGRAPARPAVDAIDLAAAARALREAAGAEFAHLVPDYAEPEASVEPAVVVEVDPEVRVSRAHHATFLPRGLVATTDMGFDLVRFWRPSGSRLRPVGEVVLPRGSGPRHAVWHPSGHLYVVTELSAELFALAPDASGAWRIVAGLSLGAPAGDLAAGIVLSRDAERVYLGLRGSDTIATVRVAGTGTDLTPLALVESGVSWPRDHTVQRDTLLVAGERSGSIASLALDLRTGVPGRVRHRTEAPNPTRILVAR
ncbi:MULTISPECIES: lactonase family protein [Microbacterium]|uniref:lactonase family protein n=1 Tax=Microbacterium TaxID=33882 RepID=UPI0010F945C2|nr:beta-propeller fold lactonase family protein [Microbacterium sp. 4NA327F11]MCK9918054.1 lactonase family protein [Microbacteriaceae bacterium K1510]